MKYLSIVISFFLISLISSCSSDPCEEVVCVNGACDDGSCLCEEGYIGPTCNLIDLEGTYFYSSIVSDPNTNCSQAYLDYMPELRGEALCDELGCDVLLYTFKTDLTMVRTYIDYEDTTDGSWVENFRSVTDGAYIIEGDVVTITEGRDRGRVMTFNEYTLADYSSFWQDCFATRTFTKRVE